jgi:hypothetical protein
LFTKSHAAGIYDADIAGVAVPTIVRWRAQMGRGVKISNEELAAVPLTRNKVPGDWNYTVHPEPLK